MTLGGRKGLSDNSHVILVKSRDEAGNEDASPAECRFTVDTARPRGSVGIRENTFDRRTGTGVSEMSFSNDGKRWSEWSTFSGSRE